MSGSAYAQQEDQVLPGAAGTPAAEGEVVAASIPPEGHATADFRPVGPSGAASADAQRPPLSHDRFTAVEKGQAAWGFEMTRIQRLWPDFSPAHEAYVQGVLVGNTTTMPQPRRYVCLKPHQPQQVFSSVRDLKTYVLQQEQLQMQTQALQMAPTHQHAMAAQSRQLVAVGDLLQQAVAGVPPRLQTVSPVEQRRIGALQRARNMPETHPLRLPQNAVQGAAAAASGSSRPILLPARRPAVLTAVQGPQGQQGHSRGVSIKQQKNVRRNDDGWSELMQTIRQKWTDFNATHEARIELVRVSYRRSGKSAGVWCLVCLY